MRALQILTAGFKCLFKVEDMRGVILAVSQFTLSACLCCAHMPFCTQILPLFSMILPFFPQVLLIRNIPPMLMSIGRQISLLCYLWDKTCQTVNYSHLSLKIYLFKINLVMSKRFNMIVCYSHIILFAQYVQCCSVSTQQKHKLNLEYACFQDKFSSAATEVRLTLYSELQTEMFLYLFQLALSMEQL